MNVPTKYVAKDGTRLGMWIHSLQAVRSNPALGQAELTTSQIRRLNEIGFVWDGKYDSAWNNAFEAARRYKEIHGDLNVLAAYVTEDGIRLGRWLCRQREAHHTTMSEERKRKLDSIGMFWEQPDPWEQKFALVRRYYEEHGGVRIPADYVMVGVWIAR